MPFVKVSTKVSAGVRIELDRDLMRICDEMAESRCERTGERVPPMADAIEQLKALVSDLHDTYGNNALTFHKQNYDARNITKRMMDVLAPYRRNSRDRGRNGATDEQAA